MRHSTTRTFTSGTSGPRWFSLILRMKEFEDGFDGVTFPTLIHIVAETAIVSFHTLPLVSHCQQSPRILCTRCFVP